MVTYQATFSLALIEVFLQFYSWEKPEYPEKACVSDLVTTNHPTCQQLRNTGDSDWYSNKHAT